VLVVRHEKEAWSTSNSGRIAHLALERVTVVDYGRTPFDPEIVEPGAWLLFPGGEPPPEERPPQIVAVDGSWRQARRIVRKILERRPVRLVTLAPSSAPPPRVLRPPHEGAMSTLEAIARVIAIVEGEEKARALDALQAALFRSVRLC
jgi:DTW domain-containing protein